MDQNWLLQKLMVWVPLVLSLSVHEWAHAYSAFRLGDDTAARMGRLTLNPISHIDPIGTILVPLVVSFGWAKPVPVDPTRFHRKVNMRKGMVITAAAGPASNVALALLCTVLLYIVAKAGMPPNGAAVRLLFIGAMINVLLALFNMLPIYPLDGSRVADGLMPHKWQPLWERFVRIGPVALLAVIFLPSWLGFSLFSWPMNFTQGLLNVVYVSGLG
jgi:Zn-dependent protease